MEKCVHILIKYLAKKPQSLFVLAMQCNKLSKNNKNNTMTHVKQHQSDRLIKIILTQFTSAASNYVQQFNRTTAKSKTFADFSMNVYELYKKCSACITSTCFNCYSQLMIECYRLCDTANEQPMSSNMDFQQALDYYANELNRRAKVQADKMAKKSTTNINESVNNSSTTITSTTTSTTTTTTDINTNQRQRRRMHASMNILI